MVKLLSAGILAALLWVVQPAAAQTSPGTDDVKKLEGELDKLKKQLQDTEARLKKAKDAAAKKDDKRPTLPTLPFGPGGKIDPEQLKKLKERLGGKDGPLANLDPDQIKKLMEQAAKMREQFGKDGPLGKIDPERLKKLRELRGKPQTKPDEKKPEEKKPETKGPSPDIEKRLDRLLKEVEELRKEIRKQ